MEADGIQLPEQQSPTIRADKNPTSLKRNISNTNSAKINLLRINDDVLNSESVDDLETIKSITYMG